MNQRGALFACVIALAALLPASARAQIPGTANIQVGGTNIIGGTSGRCLYDNAGKIGETASCGLAGGITVGTSVITGGTNGRVLYDNAGVLGELSTNGSGNVLLSAGTAAITSGKTATFSNTLTFSGTDSSSIAFGAGGTVLYNAGSAIQVVKRQTFCASGCTTTVGASSSGTYTPSTGLQYAIIECVGNGGGGGGTTSTAGNTGAAGGGGGGGYARAYVSAATIGASKAVTFGATGTGGTAGANNGVAGGDVSVGTLCVGKGGSAGSGVSNGTTGGGGGGIAGTGDVTYPGEDGQGGVIGGASVVFPAYAGRGGNSAMGTAAAARFTISTAAGTAGRNYGAGGGGAASFNGGGAVAGGDGSTGIAVITEFTNQ